MSIKIKIGDLIIVDGHSGHNEVMGITTTSANETYYLIESEPFMRDSFLLEQSILKYWRRERFELNETKLTYEYHYYWAKADEVELHEDIMKIECDKIRQEIYKDVL